MGERHAGQDLDQRVHQLRQPGRAQLGPQILARLLVIEGEVQVLADRFLHGADAVDILRQRRIDRGGRVAGRAEDDADARQPDDAGDQQHRQHEHGQEAELPVDRQQHGDDADQQHRVPDREHREFEEFLERVHVALEARHHPADMGAVHGGERHVLEMREHGAAQIEQHALRKPCRHPFLAEAAGIVGRDQQREETQRPEQRTVVGRGERAVHRLPDGERDQHLAGHEQHHRGDRRQQLPAIGPHEAEEAPHDVGIEGAVEDLLALAATGPGRGGGGEAAAGAAEAAAEHAHDRTSRTSTGPAPTGPASA